MRRARISYMDIKIADNFKDPSIRKLTKRLEYFERFGKFKVPIILDKDNKLIDGYTSYLVAVKYNISKVDVIYKED